MRLVPPGFRTGKVHHVEPQQTAEWWKRLPWAFPRSSSWFGGIGKPVEDGENREFVKGVGGVG